MKSLEYKIKSTDGIDIQVYEWLPDNLESIKGIVQIAHGMAEHAGRYSNFAEFLVLNKYAVYANDHRGHGKTAEKLENVGFLAPKNGWELMVSDARQLSSHIADKQKGKPIYVFGHSMGSFILRNYIMQADIKIEGAIFSGTMGNPGLLGQIGLLLAKVLMLFYPAKSPSVLMDKLSFGKMNNAFKPNRTKFDWLSSDNTQVDKYIDDPFCGTVFSIGFFRDFLSGVLYISKQKNIDKVAEDLSILLFSGDKDPVGNNGKGVLEVYNKFKKSGIKNITMKLFPGGRHEMLNEINKLDVYQFILDWLHKN